MYLDVSKSRYIHICANLRQKFRNKNLGSEEYQSVPD